MSHWTITPDSGSTLYAYDKGGFLQSLSVENIHSLDTDIINNIEYDAKGQRQKVQYENGTTTTYEYDAFTFRVRRIRTTRHSGSKELQDLRYWYDAVGNITLQKDLAQQSVYFDGSVADPHYDYTYDALYRLIQAEGRELAGNNSAPTYNDSSRTGITPIPIASTDTAKMRRYIQYYEYDEVGNFIQMRHTVTGGTGNWTRYYTTDATSNKLLETIIGSGTPEAYDYDSRGNIIKGLGHVQSMHYNASNRLEKIKITPTLSVFYQYDIDGQRVRKTLVNTASNQTEVRKYVGSWEIYSKFVSSSLILEREKLHISDDSGRMALIDTRTTGTGSEPAQLLRYQYSNHLGTATLELDDAAAIISYEEYYPYGSTSFQSGRSGAEVSLKRYRYTGKERDEESGLYYHGARYYVPWLGRWTAVDPLESKYAGMSPYNYCVNNPVILVDPNGQEVVISYQKFDLTKTKADQPRAEEVIYKKGGLFNMDGSEYKGSASKEADDYFNMVKETMDDIRNTDERFETVINFMENDRIGSEKITHYIGNIVPRLEKVTDNKSNFGRYRSQPPPALRGSASQVQKTNEYVNTTSSLSEEKIYAKNNSITIRFMPKEDLPQLEKELGIVNTIETVMVHELKHFWNFRQGIKEIQSQHFNKYNLSFEEIDAIHFENIYRLRKGMEARTFYSNRYGGQKLDKDDIIENLVDNYKLSIFPFTNNYNNNLKLK